MRFLRRLAFQLPPTRGIASLRDSILKSAKTIKPDKKTKRERIACFVHLPPRRSFRFFFYDVFAGRDFTSLGRRRNGVGRRRHRSSNVKVPIKIDCARWNGIYFAFDEITAAVLRLECQIARRLTSGQKLKNTNETLRSSLEFVFFPFFFARPLPSFPSFLLFASAPSSACPDCRHLPDVSRR